MPPNEPVVNNYTVNHKTLRYQLLYFLIRIKEGPQGEGIREPVSIPLQNFKEILGYIDGDTEEEKIGKLGLKLKSLTGEPDLTGKSKLLISATPQIFNDFAVNFSNNKEIKLIYDRKQLIAYEAELQERDREIAKANNVVFDPIGLKLHFQDEFTRFKKNGKYSFTSNVCSLLFGHSIIQTSIQGKMLTLKNVSNISGGKYEYNDYKLGDKVYIDAIKFLIMATEAPGGEIDCELINRMVAKLKNKKITDAIGGINSQTREKFGFEIINYFDGMLKLNAK